MSAGASPQTPLGELTALPSTIAGSKGVASRQVLGVDGRGRLEEGREKNLGRVGRDGRKRGRVGRATAPWLLRDRCICI